MAPEHPAPEEIIRRYLVEHGSVKVGIEALEQTWNLERLSARDRRMIARALKRAGVVVEPPLTRASHRDRLTLSVLAPPAAEPAAAPEPDPPPPEPEPPEPEPPEPEPEPPEPEPEPPEPDDASPEPVPAGVRAPGPAALRFGAAAVALMVVGSLGPWAKNIFVTDYGLDRSGPEVIAAAVAAALLLLVYARRARPLLLPLAAAGLGAASAGLVAADFRDLVDDSFVGPAWGLYAAFAGSAALVALSMSLLVRHRG